MYDKIENFLLLKKFIARPYLFCL